ncbi:MAG: hypothetical protein KUG56_09175, partial [Kordiimonadaceae bacterium]|nr:hypothetical protein [Kordiimonadaceae bacterium]
AASDVYKRQLLKPGKFKMNPESLDYYGIPLSAYRSNKGLRVALDAYKRIQEERGLGKVQSREELVASLPDRAKLARLVYAKFPVAAKNMLEFFGGSEKRGGFRAIFPLYEMTFFVLGVPLPWGIGEMGFKARLIIDPNIRKEFLQLEVFSKLELSIDSAKKKKKMEWSIFDGFQPMAGVTSIADISAGEVKHHADIKAGGSIALGPFELKISTEDSKLLPQAPVENVTSLHAILANVYKKMFGLEAEPSQSKTKNKAQNPVAEPFRVKTSVVPGNEIIFSWNIGALSFTLTTSKIPMEEAEMKSEFIASASVGQTQKYFFPFDFDKWDPILYSQIQDVDDIQKIA